MLLCGDFRQILPVIPCGTRGNMSEATVWDSVIVKHLHTNMRLETMGTFVCDINELMSRVYPDLLSNFKNITWLSERCILAPCTKLHAPSTQH